MIDLANKHTQDLSDIMSAARFRFTDAWDSTFGEMFRASFGGLFCSDGAKFGEKIEAYNANKDKVDEVLAAIASELDERLS